MNLQDARALFAKSNRRETRDDVGHKNLVDDYWGADPASRQIYNEAALALYTQGGEEDRELAVLLWLGSSFDEAASDALIARYTQTGDPTIASYLGDVPSIRFSQQGAQTLVERFVADPLMERALANNLVSHYGDSAVYSAYEALLGGLDELYPLRRLWSAASMAHIEDRYVACVRRKPDELRTALAEMLDEPWRSQITS